MTHSSGLYLLKDLFGGDYCYDCYGGETNQILLCMFCTKVKVKKVIIARQLLCTFSLPAVAPPAYPPTYNINGPLLTLESLPPCVGGQTRTFFPVDKH